MNNNLLLCVNGGRFDYCIMDEASQISEPLALGPILVSDRFIMIGDFYQLNPLVKSNIAEKKGLNVSLFERICKKHPSEVTILRLQYRMSKDILELSNSIVYNGVMKHANVGVASQQVEYKIQVNSMLTWLEGLKQNNVTFLKCDKVILNIDLKER
jgi:DNA replication ATP-dependent helicase Dna2